MSRFICLALLLAGLAGSLSAQQAAIQPQTRIRVQQSGQPDWTVGKLVRSSDDSLHVFTEQGLVDIPRSEITRLDVSHVRISNVSRGLKRGAIIGGAVGAALGAAVLMEQDDGDWFEYGPEVIPLGAAGGALWGGLIGVIVGSFSRHDVWEPVDTGSPAVTILVAPGADGTRLGIAARF